MKSVLFIRQMWTPVITLLLVLILSGGWLYQRMTMRDNAQQQLRQAQMSVAAVNQQIVQAGQDQQWINEYQGEYRQLQRIGFIGKDQRLDWYQALMTNSAQLGLNAVNFDIAPQQRHQPLVSVGAFMLMDTPVQFSAEMRHEGIFAQLLDALSNSHHGIFTVRECTLNHALENAPLLTQCVFEWHNLVSGVAP